MSRFSENENYLNIWEIISKFRGFATLLGVQRRKLEVPGSRTRLMITPPAVTLKVTETYQLRDALGILNAIEGARLIGPRRSRAMFVMLT